MLTNSPPHGAMQQGNSKSMAADIELRNSICRVPRYQAQSVVDGSSYVPTNKRCPAVGDHTATLGPQRWGRNVQP